MGLGSRVRVGVRVGVGAGAGLVLLRLAELLGGRLLYLHYISPISPLYLATELLGGRLRPHVATDEGALAW